jgi:hypothetical protein
MPAPVSQNDMDALFALTDDLGIHREAITVPLGKRDPGGIKQAGGQLTITLPESTPVEEWCASVLKDELAVLGFQELP